MDYSKYGSDKETEHGLFSKVYENLFGHLKGEEINFLELGLWGGGCLSMWDEFFGGSAKIVGLDVNEVPQGDEHNISVYQGNQVDEILLDRISNTHGPWDIIMDDASHSGHETLASMMILWKHLKENGIYVVEDIFYAWPHAHNRPHDGDGNMMNVIEKVIKHLPEFGIRQFHIDYMVNSGVLYVVKAVRE